MPAPLVGALASFGAEQLPGVIKRLGGGSKPKPGDLGPCPGEPDPELVVNMLANISAADSSSLRVAWAAANPSQAFPTSAEALSHAAFGGSDCKATSAAGRALFETFQRLLAKYNPSATGGIQPVAQPATTSADRLREALRNTGRDIVNSQLEILEASVEGAASGARSAAGGARAGASIGGFFTSANVPALLVLVLGAAFVLRRARA